MLTFLLLVCFAEITAILVPPKKWYQHITYLLTWPEHLGNYLKEKLEKE